MTSRARVTAVAAVIAIMSMLTGCAGAAAPSAQTRPVTTEEAQLLAIARFRSFDVGSRAFRTSVAEKSVELHLQGWVDYVTSLGYAAVTGSFDTQAILWTPTTVGIIPAVVDADGNPPLPIPALEDTAWTSTEIDGTSSRLDALLLTLSALSADRPDNPLLLQQAGALWVRSDEVDETPVTVFAVPPSDEPLTASSPPLDADTSGVRLWIDDQGLILRAEVRVGSDWSTVDFSSGPGESLVLPSTSETPGAAGTSGEGDR